MIWAPAALRDIDLIYTYVMAFNPDAAVHLAERLLVTGESLGELPERGRPISGDRRELLIVWPYIIRYRIDGDEVRIMRVRHGRRMPLP
ncbi:type II toxin-antitoxin system RelE/ParE family toxin [Azospirillum sp. TSO22-1]|uniref:type II toxin-antitoxin system RelE/ParE family toxin n=1 Tax=Azospirillum sp. TSO22-1 TaxID=716789 RepID=UPI001FFFEAA4|nr:type II toxin-antitoxin system RelE/ParE family toxin [Azospirillum sp. TSO22-1]